ncbi:iron ABC transporter permease [Campylobacter ornithocola]|uniref:Iron ABC transporter permease n=1 Tax=Campylobacter ornithocola TaxID=1848766 RepID=A0A6M8MX83_9BACT|nr:iron chelate uptake ABC transporter family permease subunit [Campylobacter ornithocola]OCX42792.1 iron ABC transporter permease [Campylobacter ornithocola]QKF57358.1 iron ABC transporter, permease protein [Campylobacter ornithocola]
MRKIFYLLIFMVCILSLAYIMIDFDFSMYIFKKRVLELFSIILVSICISVSTIIFQTITNNKILTPSIIGLDSLYILIQTLLVFFLSSGNISVINQEINFFISLSCMIIFTLIFYKILFKSNANIYFILLLGLIFGTLFSSLSLFFEVLIDPNEFMVVQGRMFASFNNIQVELILLSCAMLCFILFLLLKDFKYLDVLSLGRDNAINLGISYDYFVKKNLIFVAILISISTALVGPITFLGLLVVNITYEIAKTYKHAILIPLTILISVFVLISGVFITSKIFHFNTTISVVINFLGGIYFIYLILKGHRI